jgi:hypothetical protein
VQKVGTVEEVCFLMHWATLCLARAGGAIQDSLFSFLRPKIFTCTPPIRSADRADLSSHLTLYFRDRGTTPGCQPITPMMAATRHNLPPVYFLPVEILRYDTTTTTFPRARGNATHQNSHSTQPDSTFFMTSFVLCTS